MIEYGLSAIVLADSAVQRLIATRLYPVIWPDAPTFPLATFQRVSTTTSSVLSGPLNLVTCRMQYDSWAKDSSEASGYGQVKALAEAINNVLEGFTGTLPNGVHVLDCTLDSSFDLYDSVALAHRVSSDYMVTFSTS